METRVQSLLYQISSIVLLVVIRACAKLLKSAKILWPGLSENFSFTFYTSNDDSTIWEKYPFLLKNVSSFKKQLIGKVESFVKSNFKLSQRYKILTLFMLYKIQLTLFMFLSWLEKCFEVTENVQKFKFKGDSFGSSWGNSCTKFAILDIKYRFTCGV